MSLLPFIDDFYPTSRIFDQHFGSGLLDSDLFGLERCVPVPQRYLPPLRASYLRPWNLIPQSLSGVSDVQHDKDGFKVNLDVQHFKPDEISVKVTDNSIVVEGKHEERKDDHGFVSRSFSRRYLLPKDVDAATVASSLSSDGVLQVTASNHILAGQKERAIQITQTNQPALKGKSQEPKEEQQQQQQQQQQQ